MAEFPVFLPESSFSAAPTDSSSNGASLSSTPPTTVADSISLASEGPKPEPETDLAPLLDDEPVESVIVAKEPLSVPEPPAAARPRRSRQTPIYNLSKLSGTDVHGRRRSNGDQIKATLKRRAISSDSTLFGDADNAGNEKTATGLAHETIEARESQPPAKRPRSASANLRSPRKSTKESPPPRRIGTRLSGVQADTLAIKLATLGKRARKSFEKDTSSMSRELRRLQDTNEFSKIEEKPVWNTVWSNGKYVDPNEVEPEAPPPKRVKRDEDATEEAPTENKDEQAATGRALRPKRQKKWLDKGLYAGQEAPADLTKGLTSVEKKKLAQLPELSNPSPPNKTLPMPIYSGFRTLLNGRDFKLPFDVCNPLPPGQPKPDEWRKMTKNRFVGDAAAYWKKTPHFKDFQSKCVCKPEDGCGEDCQNRIMLYECDETNCNVGKGLCQNRAFQNLTARIKQGGRFRIGVEVIKTPDRGYGVRSNRGFEPNQIIMEYAGEIITEEECERRMNEEYKDNECYYLMSFDQNMIIDATTGSIARFVNHSCSPNCRMIKWIVSGQPRMALFAGDRPIMTGEELTYDYNFDPFSAKNVQKCLCGSENCRGVLGPRPKGEKPQAKKAEAKGPAKAGKRKHKELLEGEEDEVADAKSKPPAKKPRITSMKAVKRSLAAANLKKAVKGTVKKAVAKVAAAKGNTKVVTKKSVSSVSVNKPASGAKAKAAKPAAAATKTTKTMKTTTTTTTTTTQAKNQAKNQAKKTYQRSASTKTSVLRTYGKSGQKDKARAVAKAKAKATAKEPSPSSRSSTIVAASTTTVSSPEETKTHSPAAYSSASKASKLTKPDKVTAKKITTPSKAARQSIGAVESPSKKASVAEALETVETA